MTDKCSICGKSSVIFDCPDCGRKFCWEHTGSNEILMCPRHKLRYNKEKLIELDILDEKCNIVLKTICPQCKSDLYIKKTDEDPVRYYFKCISCEWNSYKQYPLIISEDKDKLVDKAIAEKILRHREIVYCDKPLKIIENEGEKFCIGCLIDTLERGDIFTNEMIAELINLPKEKVLPIIKDLEKQNLLKGVIDPLSKVYISLTPEYEDYLKKRMMIEKVDLKQLSEEIQLEERIVRLILINMLNNYSEINGTFIDIHTFINNDLLIDEIIDLIEGGPTPISKIEEKFNLKESQIKKLIGTALEDGKIKAFYSPDGKTIIPGEGLQTKLMDLINKEGKIFLDKIASILKIEESVLRQTIGEFKNNQQINGWYTQDRGFATIKHLENEIQSIMKIYKKIPLDEISDKIQIPKKHVETLLSDMIKDNKISGSIGDDIFERTQAIDYVKKTSSVSKFLTKKINDADNLQYVLIIHKESGSCLFSYSCSELNFDSDLVSGFLQAISSFGTEIDSSQTSPLEEIRYGGFVIAMSEGNLVKTAFICKNSPAPSLKANIKYFIINFENKFKSKLAPWTGDIHPFKKTKTLIENFFKVGSKILFFIPQVKKTTFSKKELQQKITEIIEKTGRIKLMRLSGEFGINVSNFNEILTPLVIDGVGFFSKDQTEFITEGQLMNEIGEILLKSKELKISDIANNLNLEFDQTKEILENLINDGKVNAVISEDLFKQV
ncbi:MAG: hypothetical protein EU551_01550 [Promethearchaeota archaeon]|nr:MAG: hypothetical protein EU551_01550 [Candidatus Lokiarchaeota archaeon]